MGAHVREQVVDDLSKPVPVAEHLHRLELDIERASRIDHPRSLDRFRDDLHSPLLAERVAADLDSADRSGVSGTPTFFVNGRRHYGAYDIDALSQDVSVAHARADLRA